MCKYQSYYIKQPRSVNLNLSGYPSYYIMNIYECVCVCKNNEYLK